MAESLRCRAAAALNAGAGDHKTAVNRLYYACYHAGRAVLLIEDLEPKRHAALRHLLALHFVKIGRLPTFVTRTLAHLEDERALADYVAGATVSAEEYEVHRVEGEQLLTEIERFLRESGWIA